jgi:predicted ferric reductase
MTTIEQTRSSLDELEQHPLQDIVITGLVALASVFFAVVALPILFPALAATLTGTDPKIFWYVSRGTAMVAFGLLWLSMALGVLLTNKLASVWPGAARAYDFHQYISLLGLAFGLLHGLLLMGDHYIQFSLVQVFLPFSTEQYRPVWVGVGQFGMYVWAIVVASHYLRKQIGRKAWRMIHYASFISYIMALGHGILSGTDSTSVAVQATYWISGALLLFLIVYRIMVLMIGKPATERRSTQ